MKTLIKQPVFTALIGFLCVSLNSGCMPQKSSPSTSSPPYRTPYLIDLPEGMDGPVSPEPYKKGDRYFYFVESQLMRKKGDLEKAIYFLDKCLSLDPGSLYIKKELANLFLRQRKPEKALALVQEMLTEKPDDVQLMILYGKLQQGLKEEAEAEATYEKILRIDPSQKEIYLRLGAMYMEKGDSKTA